MSFRSSIVDTNGASSGTGRATEAYLAMRGASLAISHMQMVALKVVAEELMTSNSDVRTKATIFSVRRPEQIWDRLHDTKQTIDRLDDAANIAETAASGQVSLETQSDQGWEFPAWHQPFRYNVLPAGTAEAYR
ncbi:3-oxoacyl-(acyl-carrier-protein) reductase [Colletotrichum orchidophilum]|uniref:3-oxoacyl-(Acyl-carrier-protein) reductase n=1 Tax=Colletotrichum orchidophilum TaxID=1209926 RepID=A0A1G4B602_9PEZI|nr:3-oxoacyl-(acyl-carrier-protein) reductase [Colletotrichum orchidophilum]OHE96841.1 3-oxoacyl-(acyl-carrier-protein) reductase [Colletotrichum orchidophilum]